MFQKGLCLWRLPVIVLCKMGFFVIEKGGIYAIKRLQCILAQNEHLKTGTQNVKEHVLTCSVYVRLKIYTAVILKEAIFWEVVPYGPCLNRRFRATFRFTGSSETLVLTRPTRYHIPEDVFLHTQFIFKHSLLNADLRIICQRTKEYSYL
jgi:hypothetical protein